MASQKCAVFIGPPGNYQEHLLSYIVY